MAKQTIAQLTAVMVEKDAEIAQLKAQITALEERVKAQQVAKAHRVFPVDGKPESVEDATWARLTPAQQRQIRAKDAALKHYGAGWKPRQF